MFCYQAAAYRRSKSIASIVTFGSPVDTLAALPMGLPPNIAPGVANFMADHVFNRLDIPGWLARTGFQMLDPLKTAKARVDFVRQLHDREALLPREAQRGFLESEGWIAWSGPADLRTAQTIHRAQPDDDRRFRHQQPTRDADRYHLPDTGFRRRSRRHRPAGRGAGYPARSAQRRGLRISHPDGPFRLGCRIQSSAGDVADRRRLGAVDLREREKAHRHLPDGGSADRTRRPRRRAQFPADAWTGRGLRGCADTRPRSGRRGLRGEQVHAHLGGRDRSDTASTGPAGPDQRPHPDLVGPHHRRTGARRA